jgi:alkylhydroperoxidase family enzyme
MRVPYAPKEAADPADTPIYERIAARRAPRPLIPLDLALLHCPPVADGWNSFIGAIRTSTSLRDAIKELAICRIAVLNHAVHEWNAHGPLALRGGVSPEGLETAKAAKVIGQGDMAEIPTNDEQGLRAEEWAVLAYTDQMTRNVEVDQPVFNRLKEYLNDKEIVELTATIAAYNCVSRFLVALDVGENNGKKMKSSAELAQ